MFYIREIKHRVGRLKKKTTKQKSYRKKRCIRDTTFQFGQKKIRSNFPLDAVASLALEAIKTITGNFFKKLIRKEKNKKEDE